MDSKVKVWDLASGRSLRTLKGHSDWVSAVAVTPDGKRAVSAGWKTLKVWELDTGRPPYASRPFGDDLWRGGNAGREAGGFRVWGPNAEGVGSGHGPIVAHAGRRFFWCYCRGGDARRQTRGFRVWGWNAE